MQYFAPTLQPALHSGGVTPRSIRRQARTRTSHPSATTLIHVACAAVDDAITALFTESRNGDGQLFRELSDDALADRRALAALHLCLSSAAGLLEASETILKQRNNPTSAPCMLTLLRLSDDAEIAGRAAHRAALVLAELLDGRIPRPA